MVLRRVCQVLLTKQSEGGRHIDPPSVHIQFPLLIGHQLALTGVVFASTRLIRSIPILAATLLCATLVTLAAAEPEWNGKVVGITDGDTLSVLRDGRAVKIRLHGIDAPEKRQPFGQRAKQYASSLVFGKVVRVWPVDTDRYGRTVAEVFLTDGRSLNYEMVRAGLAWWYIKYAPNDLELKNIEKQSWIARRGLWVDGDPQPPWEWRKAKKDSAGRSSADKTAETLGRSEVRSQR